MWSSSTLSILLKTTSVSLVFAPRSESTSIVVFAKLQHPGMRGVEHVNEEIGQSRLFQGGVKGFDQLVRQVPDEPDRVGKQERLFVWQRDLARGRVERREEFILHQHFRPGEAAQQGRFSHVRVADDGGIRERARACGPCAGWRGLRTDSNSRRRRSICPQDFAAILLELASRLRPSPRCRRPVCQGGSTRGSSRGNE